MCAGPLRGCGISRAESSEHIKSHISSEGTGVKTKSPAGKYCKLRLGLPAIPPTHAIVDMPCYLLPSFACYQIVQA